jgi:outer membrane protein OmpA-like peptidoglycan-associated protein
MNILLTLTVLIGIMLAPACSQALEIRQEVYTYLMAVTQDVTCETFVISENSSAYQKPVNRFFSTGSRPLTLYFQFNSAVPDPSEISRLLTGLQRLGISRDIPLNITGHACELGKDQYNQTLSLRRARAVADLLLASGFNVTEVSGRGSRNPLTTDPEQYSLNRRVEISSASDKNDNSPASRGR